MNRTSDDSLINDRRNKKNLMMKGERSLYTPQGRCGKALSFVLPKAPFKDKTYNNANN
jgi:hypothetical protein